MTQAIISGRNIFDAKSFDIIADISNGFAIFWEFFAVVG